MGSGEKWARVDALPQPTVLKPEQFWSHWCLPSLLPWLEHLWAVESIGFQATVMGKMVGQEYDDSDPVGVGMHMKNKYNGKCFSFDK